MSERSASRRSKRDALTPSYCEYPGCDWPYKIQRHRIMPGRDGGKYKLGNVIGLCPNHHWLADEGLLSAEYLAEIVYRRIELIGDTEIIDSETSAGTGGPEEFGHRSSEEPAEGHGERPADAAAASSAGSTCA